MKKKFFKLLFFVFFGLVIYYLYQRFSHIEVDDLKKGFLAVKPWTIGVSIFLTFLNYFILTNFDYFGLRQAKCDSVSYFKAILSAFVCYAVNFNIGSFIGGMGFRYRIYSGWDIPISRIHFVIFFSVVSNWIGFILLSGIVLLIVSQTYSHDVFLSSSLMLVLGIVAIGIVLAYLFLCAKGHKKDFKKWSFEFPSLKMALLQLILSITQWLLLVYIISLFLTGLGGNVSFLKVLYTYLISSIAGVVTHIPAGLGVLETIFLKMKFDIQPSSILVALICFRAVYYLVPLILAIPCYLGLEFYQKKTGNRK